MTHSHPQSKLINPLVSLSQDKVSLFVVQQKRRKLQLLASFFSLIPITTLISLQSGAIDLNLVSLLQFKWFNAPSELEQLHWNVLTELRLPRFLMTFITGMGLASAGAVMQAICRNPLADPGLIGVSSGAAVFASITFVFASHWSVPPQWTQYLVPLMAFIGGISVGVMLFKLATLAGTINTLLLVLAGIALNALAGTVIGLLTYMSDDSTLRLMTFWTMGSYAGVGWTELVLSSIGIAFALVIFWRLRLPLTLMLTGDWQARHMGVNVSRVKTLSLVGVAIATACAVSFTGIVGFIGLVIPHICRLLIGPDLRLLLPSAALSGGILVSLADSAARTFVSPAELPVGIITALFGAPFFIYLLLRQKQDISHA